MATTTTSFDNSVGPQVRERGRAQRRGFGVLFGLLLVASAQTATQSCARDFGYQAALGPSFGRLYPPWAIAVWASRWGAQYPAAFQAAANAGLLVASVGAIALVAFKLTLARANPYLHGSARWASEDDIRRSGLLGARI
jgi:type IV secretion system protein VirD4